MMRRNTRLRRDLAAAGVLVHAEIALEDAHSPYSEVMFQHEATYKVSLSRNGHDWMPMPDSLSERWNAYVFSRRGCYSLLVWSLCRFAVPNQ
jgi:hypothetical protein